MFSRLLRRRLYGPRFTWNGLLGTGLATPGILLTMATAPTLWNTVGGNGLFWPAAGAGSALGLAFALRGAGVVRQIWVGLALGLALAAGAGAVRLNAESPGSPRYLVPSHVVDEFVPQHHGRRRSRFRSLELRFIEIEWQGEPLRVAVGRDAGRWAEGSPLLLSVYEGRLGYPVIEDIRRAAP